MLYTIDENREMECFTPLMNGEKRDPLHHICMERSGMLYTIDGEKPDALHH